MKKIISLLLCFLVLTSYSITFAENTETETVYESVEDVIAAADELGADKLEVIRSYTSGKHYFAGTHNDVDHADLVDSDNSLYCKMDIKSLNDGAKGTNVQSRFLTTGADVAEGDIIFFAFKIRARYTEHSTGCVIGSGNYRMTNTGSNNASISFKIPVPEEGTDPEWVWCYKATSANYAHTKDESAQIDFILGYAVQSLDIKDITVINFKDTLTLKAFPQREFTYEGMEEDAAWRTAANERIEQYRKSDIKVRVVDGLGAPVDGAEVAIDQQKHLYRFGTYMPKRRIMEDSSTTSAKKIQNNAFQNRLKSMFNTTGFENAFKPGNINDNEEFIQTVIDFAEENDMSLRGHTLVWRESDALAAMTTEERSTYDSGDDEVKKEIMKSSIRRHVDTYTKKYGDYIDSWDVVNEFLNHKDEIYKIIGGDMNEVAEWFKIAGKNTDGSLVLNDFGIISYDETAQNSHYNMAKKLKDLGAPITTVGMQAHLGTAIPPAYIIDILNKFQNLGMDIEITEFTYENNNETVQANYVRDFLTAVFSHPSTSSIYLWGFAMHEIGDRQNSALTYPYNVTSKEYALKPSGEVWMDLIYNQWWTNEKGTTNEKGFFETRAFHGDHKLTITVDGVSKEFPIKLGTVSKQFVYNTATGTLTERAYNFEETGISVSVDAKSEKLTVEGNIDFVGGTDATMLITDEEGKVVYFDQTPRSVIDGSFNFTVKTSNFLHKDSQYTVKIGTQGKECIKFWLDGDASRFDYTIKHVAFMNESGVLDSFADVQPNDIITAEVQLNNKTEQMIFIGLFDAKGRLLDINHAIAEQTDENEMTCTASISTAGFQNCAYVKAFIWADGTALSPITTALLFN